MSNDGDDYDAGQPRADPEVEQDVADGEEEEEVEEFEVADDEFTPRV